MENQVDFTQTTENGFKETMPKTWLVESILVTLFCCLPLGIVGIINASNVTSKYEAGDVAGSQKASEEAKKWVKYGFFAGLAVAVLYIIFIVIIGGGAIAAAASEQY